MKESPESKNNYLYVIGRKEGPIKIGVSVSPMGRIGSLQTGCPFILELLHTQKMHNREHAFWHEQTFKIVYANKNIIGEWFDLDAELAIESIESALDIELHFGTDRITK